MAKAKAATAPAELPGNFLEEYQSAETLNPYLESAMSELGISADGSDATIHVSHIDTKTSVESKIWQGPVEDYDLKSIAEKFGSAAYRVKLYARIITGQKVLKGNAVINWLLSPEQDAKLKMLRENPQALQQQGQPQQMQGITPETLAAAIKAAMPPPVVGPSPMEIFAQVAGLMKQIMPAPVVAQPQQTNVIETIRAIAGIMKETGAGSRNDDDTPARGSTNANDIWLKVLDKIPLLLDVVGNGKAAQSLQQLPPPAATPGGAETPAGQQIHTPEGENMNVLEAAQLKQMQMGLAFLCAQANAGHDPVLYADVVMDQVPEAALEQLLALPDTVAHLQQLHPDVANHREWFVTLFKEIREAFTVDPDEPADTGGSGGAAKVD